jgi:hypothetical protein
MLTAADKDQERRDRDRERIEVRLRECAFASPSHTQPGGVDLVISESRY